MTTTTKCKKKHAKGGQRGERGYSSSTSLERNRKEGHYPKPTINYLVNREINAGG